MGFRVWGALGGSGEIEGSIMEKHMDNKMEHETKLGRYRDVYVYIYIYLELYTHRDSWFSNDSRSTTALELKNLFKIQ